ncbi:hypothetical protein NMY22_g16317 [Coprinellus aureogranulatus]|nr:hypothetical protein NMY22_g16317 [Coprinellus aureogranulatus]
MLPTWTVEVVRAQVSQTAHRTHVRPSHSLPWSLHLLLRLNHASLEISNLPFTRHATTIHPALDCSHPVTPTPLLPRSPYTVRELQRKEVPFPGSDLLSFLAPAKNLSVAPAYAGAQAVF